MKKRIEDLTVVENRRLNNEFFVLKLHSSQGLPEILPGQFAQVKVEGSKSTFLRRPISIYNSDPITNTIELLIKIVGDGTATLSLLRPKEKLNLIYPLGNSFTMPKGEEVLLVGGGTGVAPMLFLGKYIYEKKGIKPQFLLGYRSEEHIIELEKFKAIGEVLLTTEDGSKGHKGYVIDHPLLMSNDFFYKRIYTCGPEIMMREIAHIAKMKKVLCEVSLENLMGCGIGACLCCVVDTHDKGNVNTCTEGPIFNTKELKWQI